MSPLDHVSLSADDPSASTGSLPILALRQDGDHSPPLRTDAGEEFVPAALAPDGWGHGRIAIVRLKDGSAGPLDWVGFCRAKPSDSAVAAVTGPLSFSAKVSPRVLA